MQMEEADTLCDKIAIIAMVWLHFEFLQIYTYKQGRLRAVGDSLHLKTRYGAGYHIQLICQVVICYLLMIFCLRY